VRRFSWTTAVPPAESGRGAEVDGGCVRGLGNGRCGAGPGAMALEEIVAAAAIELAVCVADRFCGESGYGSRASGPSRTATTAVFRRAARRTVPRANRKNLHTGDLSNL
jgi:hypothetical protein